MAGGAVLRILLWRLLIQVRRIAGAGVGRKVTDFDLGGRLSGMPGVGKGLYALVGQSLRVEWNETRGHGGERGRIRVHIHARRQAWSARTCSPDRVLHERKPGAEVVVVVGGGDVVHRERGGEGGRLDGGPGREVNG